MIAYDVKVTAEQGLNVRAEADKDSEIVKVVNKDDTFQIIEEKNGFGRLADKSGWVMLQFVAVDNQQEEKEEEADERVLEEVDKGGRYSRN